MVRQYEDGDAIGQGKVDGLEDGGILRDFRGLRYNVRRKDFRWTGGWR